jgi:hypothetical protein
MMLRWLLYAAFAFILIRVIQATMRVLQDGRGPREDHPQPSPPPPSAKRDDFRDAKDADFIELPPEEKKREAGQ